MQDKLTVDHASRGTARSIEALRLQMIAEEAELAQTENDIARSNLQAADIEAVRGSTAWSGFRQNLAQIRLTVFCLMP